MENQRLTKSFVGKKSTQTVMIMNARAYNNVLTERDCKAMTESELLANCHPSDRMSFERMLYEDREAAKAKSKSENQ